MLGKPCYELLGGAAQQSITPYASLQPETGSYEDYRDSMIEWARKAVAAGFRAVKAEITLAGPYAHTGLREPWERSTEVLAGVRDAVGPDVAVLVDVQYAFPDADTALQVLKTWQDYGLFFVETPLWPDDLDGYRRLAPGIGRRRPYRSPAGGRSGRPARPASRAPPLEDRHLRRCRGSPGCHREPLPLHRVHARQPHRLRAPARRR